MDLIDAVSYHQLVLLAEGRSSATLRLYLLYEKRFLEFLADRGLPATLDQLDPTNARQAVLWFQQRGAGARGGAAATRMFLNVLKTWAAFLAHEGVWSDSPLERVARVKIRTLERQPFSRAEVLALLAACDLSRMPARDRALVQLLLDTGARIGEVTGLRLDDVDLERRQIRVLGKGNRERTIPIGTPTQPGGGPLPRALRAWLGVRSERIRRHPERGAHFLFLTLAGFRLTAEGGTDVIKHLGQVAGVPNATPHRFRHTFCTVYLTSYPGDELGLRRIVGHLSKDVLATYVHLSQNAIAQRVEHVAPTQRWLRDGS